MRTIIDITPEQLKPLDLLCKEEGVSSAEMVRRAISTMLKENPSRKDKMDSLKAVFGMWKDRDDFGDGLEYQLKIRSEWDDRDREIDRRLGLLPEKDEK